MILKYLYKKCTSFLFPHACILCQHKSDQSMDLCTSCALAMPHIHHACLRCGNPLDTTQKLCGNCLKNPPPFHRTLACFHYQDAIAHMIIRLKFHHQLAYAEILGRLITQRLSHFYHTPPECIIPVPLHPKRLQERGFNQSLEIARPIARYFNIPIDIKHCKRIKYTEAQATLPAKMRKHNVKNAFHIHANFHAKYVAIVDDVMTTGHTITEFAKTLRNHGVQKIDIWCCARAHRGKP